MIERYEIIYGRELIKRACGLLNFEDIDLLAKETKSRPFYKNRTSYLLLTKENFAFWMKKSRSNYARLHGGAAAGFVFKVYLKMRLPPITPSFQRIERPTQALVHQIEFSLSESELETFLDILNFE